MNGGGGGVEWGVHIWYVDIKPGPEENPWCPVSGGSLFWKYIQLNYRTRGYSSLMLICAGLIKTGRMGEKRWNGSKVSISTAFPPDRHINWVWLTSIRSLTETVFLLVIKTKTQIFCSKEKTVHHPNIFISCQLSTKCHPLGFIRTMRHPDVQCTQNWVL